MAGLIAQNYGDALFSLAKEVDKVNVYQEQLKMILTSFQEEPMFLQIMAHPKMDKEQKKNMLTNVYGKAIDITVLNFMKILVDKNRFSQFQDICQVFHKMYNEEHNIIVAYVTSAKALQQLELNKLQDVLEKKTNKHVELVVNIDEDVMAGIRVKIGDQVIDNTARTRLENLKDMVEKSENTRSEVNVNELETRGN